MTDDDLRELLTDSVADVEPAYRLDVIKARTSRPSRRRGWYAVGGAVLAAAAVVTAVSVVNDDNRPRREGPAADPSRAVGLYFVGETPAGPRLYREFQRVSGGPVAALESITTAHGPDDPDYGTIWPDGYFRAISVENDTIEIGLGTWDDGPPEISREGARLAIQQVVYTAQAAVGRTLPVRFYGKDRPDFADTIGSIQLAGEFERAPQIEVLSLVSISDPGELLRVKDSLVARGRANSFEANVPWQIKDESGDIVLDGFTTALGWGHRLYEWETERIDVSGLKPGRYTFVAMTDDPSGGEGPGPFTDTRTIIVD